MTKIFAPSPAAHNWLKPKEERYFKAINKGVKSHFFFFFFFFLLGFPGALLRTLLIKRIRLRENKHRQVKKVSNLFYNP